MQLTAKDRGTLRNANSDSPEYKAAENKLAQVQETLRNDDYITQRNALIPEAERRTNAIFAEMQMAPDKIGWGKEFLRQMNELAGDAGLVWSRDGRKTPTMPPNFDD